MLVPVDKVVYNPLDFCNFSLYPRPEGFPRALTRLGKPGTIHPAALLAREVRWRRKEVRLPLLSATRG
jgi:hypothetical protein